MIEEDQFKICYVIFQDHHWFKDEMFLEDLEDEDLGINQALVHEVGFLIKKTKDYVVLTTSLDPPMFLGSDEGKTVLKRPSKILRRDIVKMKIFDIPRPCLDCNV